MHRLATIHDVTDDRQTTDASLSHKRDRTKYGRLNSKSHTVLRVVRTCTSTNRQS